MLTDDLKAAYGGRRVLVTGHTGFKGSWLCCWLTKLGAEVSGISLAPDQGADNLFDRGALADQLSSHIQDIRVYEPVRDIMGAAAPELIFHLAAQPLVRRSYRDPLGTFATNVMGTAHVLEAARQLPNVRAVVCVTTDKVYDNREWCWPYRETDPLGGADPYSASKSAAEMVARTYQTALRSDKGYRMATARGGNVIGGGDWSEDRLVPDIIRAIRSDTEIELRHPGATRPWQHVLELCLGYLMLGARLAGGGRALANAYNFGPDPTNEMPVRQLVGAMLKAWGKPDQRVRVGQSAVHESNYLRLDSSLARADLGWRPFLNFEQTTAWTANWYKQYCDDPTKARFLMEHQISAYSEFCSSQTSDLT